MRALSITCALIVVSARIASAGAGGTNLGWNDCGGDPSTLNRVFACDTNVGVHRLVVSFVAPSCVNRVSANEAVVDLRSSSVTFPSWWGLRTGLCRQSSMTLNVDFTAGPFTCYDYWQGGAIGGLSMDPPSGNRTRIKGVFALPAATRQGGAKPGIECGDVYSPTKSATWGSVKGLYR